MTNYADYVNLQKKTESFHIKSIHSFEKERKKRNFKNILKKEEIKRKMERKLVQK